jgi:hypothetical protein
MAWRERMTVCGVVVTSECTSGPSARAWTLPANSPVPSGRQSSSTKTRASSSRQSRSRRTAGTPGVATVVMADTVKHLSGSDKPRRRRAPIVAP